MKNRLKDLREDHDLTQQMVADQIGITQRKYSYIETGIQQLTAELLVSLALLYNKARETSRIAGFSCFVVQREHRLSSLPDG